MLRRSHGSGVRASLVLVVLAAAGMTGGIGPSSARAAVFTNLSLPTITGTAVEGQTLSEVHANWSSPPDSYVIQWNRCNSSGKDCESIPKARMQTYSLTAEDVGFTIRVGESARDAAGAVTPAESEPTAVVQALAAGEHQGGSGGGGSSPPVSCCNTPAHVTPVGIKSLLARQLVPSGKTTSISGLLARGSVSMSFKFPKAGTLVVHWYLVSLAGKTEKRPVLVAAGQAAVRASKSVMVKVGLTAQGKKLLRHAGEIDLEADGAFTPKGEDAVSAVKRFSLESPR